MLPQLILDSRRRNRHMVGVFNGLYSKLTLEVIGAVAGVGGAMTFCPQFAVTPWIVRQIVAIERTTGFLNAVRLEPDWMAKLRRRIENPVHPFRVSRVLIPHRRFTVYPRQPFLRSINDPDNRCDDSVLHRGCHQKGLSPDLVRRP